MPPECKPQVLHNRQTHFNGNCGGTSCVRLRRGVVRSLDWFFVACQLAGWCWRVGSGLFVGCVVLFGFWAGGALPA